MHLDIHIHTLVNTHTCVYVYIHIYLYMYLFLNTHVHLYMHFGTALTLTLTLTLSPALPHSYTQGTKVKSESCHTYEWVMSYMWMSHVTHMNESQGTRVGSESHGIRLPCRYICANTSHMYGCCSVSCRICCSVCCTVCCSVCCSVLHFVAVCVAVCVTCFCSVCCSVCCRVCCRVYCRVCCRGCCRVCCIVCCSGCCIVCCSVLVPHICMSNDSYVTHMCISDAYMYETHMYQSRHTYEWNTPSTQIYLCVTSHISYVRHVWMSLEWAVSYCHTCAFFAGIYLTHIWIIYACDMTHLYCNVTHSYVWHESFICVTWVLGMYGVRKDL